MKKSEIEKKLKWKPSIKSKKDFDNILKKTIEWYEKNAKKIKNKKSFYI
jgi:dTDP-D-glucose 4,6-dehydratase